MKIVGFHRKFEIFDIHISQQWELFAFVTSLLPPNTPSPINKNHDMVKGSCALYACLYYNINISADLNWSTTALHYTNTNRASEIIWRILNTPSTILSHTRWVVSGHVKSPPTQHEVFCNHVVQYSQFNSKETKTKKGYRTTINVYDWLLLKFDDILFQLKYEKIMFISTNLILIKIFKTEDFHKF